MGGSSYRKSRREALRFVRGWSPGDVSTTRIEGVIKFCRFSLLRTPVALIFMDFTGVKIETARYELPRGKYINFYDGDEISLMLVSNSFPRFSFFLTESIEVEKSL